MTVVLEKAAIEIIGGAVREMLPELIQELARPYGLTDEECAALRRRVESKLFFVARSPCSGAARRGKGGGYLSFSRHRSA